MHFECHIENQHALAKLHFLFQKFDDNLETKSLFFTYVILTHQISHSRTRRFNYIIVCWLTTTTKKPFFFPSFRTNENTMRHVYIFKCQFLIKKFYDDNRLVKWRKKKKNNNIVDLVFRNEIMINNLCILNMDDWYNWQFNIFYFIENRMLQNKANIYRMKH